MFLSNQASTLPPCCGRHTSIYQCSLRSSRPSSSVSVNLHTPYYTLGASYPIRGFGASPDCITQPPSSPLAPSLTSPYSLPPSSSPLWGKGERSRRRAWEGLWSVCVYPRLFNVEPANTTLRNRHLTNHPGHIIQQLERGRTRDFGCRNIDSFTDVRRRFRDAWWSTRCCCT